MNILIVGFGSIGKRHYKNLLELGYNNLRVYDPLDAAFVDFPEVERINSISVEKAKEFQVAFVCSPNNQHIKHGLICAQAGCHLFIEKPLSHNLVNLDKLQKLCAKKKIITLVGCNMRFHPCLQYIKEYLTKKNTGGNLFHST